MVRSSLSRVASPTDSISIPQVQSRAFEADASRNQDENGTNGVDEDEKARIERLGRERPPKFKSLTAEICFCYSLLASMITVEYFVSGFSVLLPTIVERLDIPQASQVWPSSAFSLVTAAFLLPFGRLGDMYGGYPMYLGGLAWFCVWSLIAGFSHNQLMFDFCRALQGLGCAAFLPAGVMLMGAIYRPGPRKNLVFSLYGAAAPLGFFIGVFFAGLTGQYLRFGWYFWIGAILVLSTILAAFWTVPNDAEERKALGLKMDWMGSILIVSGLVLVVYAITDSSHAPQGWRTPYIYITLIVGSLLLMGAVYVEGWVATAPLLPPTLFDIPYIKPLFLSLFLSYGVFGVFLLYGTFYMQDIMGGSPLQLVAWFAPMGLGGCIIAITGGYVLHLLSGTVLLIISAFGWIITSLLFALAPTGANYWAYVFPAMIGATVGIDISYNVANVFITTSLLTSQQGLAGALLNSLLFLGIAFVLSFADVTHFETAHLGLKESYQAVFWYQLAVQLAALAIMIAFVRIRKAESDLTADEKLARGKEMAEDLESPKG
ncbi:hypothetical protein EPUS_08548 [Endocarpon pusillum Z07020]|uniref:Major facilitator superfamily (MFS) profile domain-containing protein n=1 Tax=Endocarpon pusillum (strain Z07020 / HMAS-L-300199) TaxID=1263415 RepID=U1HS94_ENDPU|nr:uncharacterized protein EPUS_08548 [Endocarpon pusillum Z07020]ERF73405.1 hypothetical protein EPUS_08548 [Endocarpon pusillum Z07020]